MKLREAGFAAAGVLLLGYATQQIRGLPFSVQQTVLNGSCQLPATVIAPPTPEVRGTAIVIHGLSASRRIMLWTGKWLSAEGLRVYLFDLPGHGDNSNAFTYADSERCAAEAIETLAKDGEITPDRTVIIGHSMGGEIAVRMADHFPSIATVAISPAPMVLPQRMPANLLVISAQFDLPPLKQAAESLERAAAGERTRQRDFLDRRAFELIRVTHASHTSLIFDPSVESLLCRWVDQALTPTSGESLATPEARTARVRNLRADPLYSLLGMLGLLFLFPIAASGVTAALRARGQVMSREPATLSRVQARWLIAAFLAVCILHFIDPLSWLHVYTGTYLASLLLLVAIVAGSLDMNRMRSLFFCSPRAGITAVVLGLATILAFGAWLNWQMTDLWMTAYRWWRFALLFPLLIPYHFAEEVAIGPPPDIGEPGRRAARIGRFLILRLTLWLACLFALLLFNSGQILIVLMTLYFAGFSILQRAGSDGVQRRTGSATAAAAFGAILAAWFIAAVFPLT